MTTPRPSRRAALSALLVVIGGAGVASAGRSADGRTASGRAGASARLFRPLQVVSVSPLGFGKVAYTDRFGPELAEVVVRAAPPVVRTSDYARLFSGGGETPAVVRLSGEPGEPYLIMVAPAPASPGNLRVEALTFWSANAGDATATKQGVFDRQGRDTLRIGGTLLLPRTARPITPVCALAPRPSYKPG